MFHQVPGERSRYEKLGKENEKSYEFRKVRNSVIWEKFKLVMLGTVTTSITF